MKKGYVYILANYKHGTLYIGVTSDLIKRIWQHRGKFVEGFTKKYSLQRLVWYECHDTIESAIVTEKKLKNRSRHFKIALIEKMNPHWNDLYSQLTGMDPALSLREPQDDEYL